MAAPISKIVRRPSTCYRGSDFCIGLMFDPASKGPINALREKLPFGQSRWPYWHVLLLFAVPGRHLEFYGENLQEFASQASPFPVEIGPPNTLHCNHRFFIRLGIPSPALIDLLLRLLVSLKTVIDDMARNPVKHPKSPYTNIRPFNPKITISHSIPGEFGKLYAGPGGRIMKELESDYARGILPPKAVGLHIFEHVNTTLQRQAVTQ